MEKLNVSVILPIKSSKTLNFDDYFNKAIQSIKNQKLGINELVIVHTNETSLVEYLNGYDFGDINVVKHEWTKEPNYASQVNYGVRSSKSEWVSLFEFDDEYSSIWFKNVKLYTESYPDYDAFLPIVVDTTDKELFAGFTNEATFAANFSSGQYLKLVTNILTYVKVLFFGIIKMVKKF